MNIDSMLKFDNHVSEICNKRFQTIVVKRLYILTKQGDLIFSSPEPKAHW